MMPPLSPTLLTARAVSCSLQTVLCRENVEAA